MIKNSIKIGVLLAIVIYLSYRFNNNKGEEDFIRENQRFEKGIVSNTKKTTNGVWVDYSYIVNEKEYRCRVNYTSGSKIASYQLPFNVLVVYAENKPSISRIFLRKEDSETFEIPDSIKQKVEAWE